MKDHSKSNDEHGECEGESEKGLQHIYEHHHVDTKVGELPNVQQEITPRQENDTSSDARFQWDVIAAMYKLKKKVSLLFSYISIHCNTVIS